MAVLAVQCEPVSAIVEPSYLNCNRTGRHKWHCLPLMVAKSLAVGLVLVHVCYRTETEH